MRFFMRVIILLTALISVFCLTSCTRVINSAADELRMYQWLCEQENGTVVTLSFDDTDAALNIGNDSFSLDVEGLCTVKDDKLTICDAESHHNYTFGYRLYGDRVELNFGSGVIELKKAD